MPRKFDYSVIVTAPMTGEVSHVRERTKGSRAGTIITAGGARPVGLDELHALVDLKTTSDCRSEVIDEDVEASECQLLVESDDQAWIDAVVATFTQVDVRQELNRMQELVDFDDGVQIGVAADGSPITERAERRSMLYDKRRTPQNRFAKITLTADADAEHQAIKAARLA